MVYEAIDHRRGDRGIAEDLTPAGERLVGRHDDRRALVAGSDQLKAEVGPLGFEPDVANFVPDASRRLLDPSGL